MSDEAKQTNTEQAISTLIDINREFIQLQGTRHDIFAEDIDQTKINGINCGITALKVQGEAEKRLRAAIEQCKKRIDLLGEKTDNTSAYEEAGYKGGISAYNSILNILEWGI